MSPDTISTTPGKKDAEGAAKPPTRTPRTLVTPKTATTPSTKVKRDSPSKSNANSKKKRPQGMEPPGKTMTELNRRLSDLHEDDALVDSLLDEAKSHDVQDTVIDENTLEEEGPFFYRMYNLFVQSSPCTPKQQDLVQ